MQRCKNPLRYVQVFIMLTVIYAIALVLFPWLGVYDMIVYKHTWRQTFDDGLNLTRD